MFQQKQSEEFIPLVEISFVTLNPGAVTNGSSVVATGAATLGSVGSASPATFAVGDTFLSIYPLAGTATLGVRVSGTPSATPGTGIFTFFNGTGGTVTPVSGTYMIVASRTVNTLVS